MKETPVKVFDVFLHRCINVVGATEESAKGHLRHTGLEIEV
jgi:hypothetical protein